MKGRTAAVHMDWISIPFLNKSMSTLDYNQTKSYYGSQNLFNPCSFNPREPGVSYMIHDTFDQNTHNIGNNS